MSKTLKLSEQIENIQQEIDDLKFLKSLFDTACKKEFGHSISQIHKMIDAQEKYEARKAAQQGQRNQLERSEN